MSIKQGFFTTILALLWSLIVMAQDVDTTGITLADVVVTGARATTDARHLPMTVTTISKEKLTEFHQTSILPTLNEQVPGLFVTTRGMLGYGVSGGAAGGINLRGISGGAGQLLVLIDGQPQYQGIYGHPISDSYTTMMAQRVEVLRGPASVLYGSNAMGGVINIVTNRQQVNGVKTSINLAAGSYGTFIAQAINQLKTDKFLSSAGLQYERSDNHRPHMGFEQYDANLNLNYSVTPHWDIFATGNVTHFNASNPGTTTTPLLEADQWITRAAVAIGVENHYNHTNGRLSIYDNFGFHKINDGYSPDSEPQTRLFRSKDALIGVAWYQNMQAWQGANLTLGIDYQHIYGKAYYTDRMTGEVLDTPNKQSARSHRNEIATYLELRQDISHWLTLDAGIRFDHHSVTGSEWIPQGGIVLHPITDGEIKAMISKGFRNPTMREMYLYPPSNEELQPERIINYELSWKQRLPHVGLTYGINLFLLNGDNMIQTAQVDGKMRNINTGEINNKGIEIEASWNINSHWSVNTNHALLHMKNPVIGAPKYKGYLGAKFITTKWTASLGLMQVSNLYTAVGTMPIKEHFTLLNATVGYQVIKQLALWVKGENLLAQRYEINAGFPMPKATFMAGVNVNF